MWYNGTVTAARKLRIAYNISLRRLFGIPKYNSARTLYIRRRSQLLRDNAIAEVDPCARRDYLRLRAGLLAERYGTVPVSEHGSVRSRTLSLRSVSRQTLESQDSLEGGVKHWHAMGLKSYTYDNVQGVVPTVAAEASRAMAGDTSIDENYAFAGMHHIFDQHQAAVTTLKFANNDSSRLACCSIDGTISICQVIPPPATVILVLNGHKGGVTDFVWSLSNESLLSVSLDGTARLWSVASGECVRMFVDSTASEVLSCVFQPLNNNLFVTGNSRSHVQVMNVSTGKVVKGGTGKVLGRTLSLCFNSTGKILWASDDRGYIFSFLFDLESARIQKANRITVCEGRAVTSMSARSWVNREARDPSLLVNCAVNALVLFRISSDDGALTLKKKFPIRQRGSQIRSTFCPLMSFRQGACVISGSEDMCVYFFDIERETRQCVNKLQGHSAPVLDVSFNCDESLLASCDAQGLVIVWKRD